ncbi:MAG: AMP-binding protein [Spirochaetales bacterium]|nr:AMP-binding protein [Spirochaetales bacterium]
MPEDGIAGKFISTCKDENGILNAIEFHNHENFNFAYDIVDVLGKEQPDRLAMLHLSNEKEERRFTFKDIMEGSSKAANMFVNLGIKKGDRVMLVLKRHYQFWYSIIALHKIGAIAIPTTHLLVQHDFEYRFKAGNVTAIVATGDNGIPEIVDAADKGTVKIKITTGSGREGWHNFNEELEKCSAEFPKPADYSCGKDPMLMFFTSGTTTYPKITVHNYLYPLGHFITAKYWNRVNRDGIHLTISDTGWGKALWGKLYGQWLCEAAIFTFDFNSFSAKEILQLIEQYHITTFCAPPTVYRVMIRLNMKKYDLSSLEYVTTAGEAMNAEVSCKFTEATGLPVMEGFGQTETTLIIGTLDGMTQKPGSMGKPNPLYKVQLHNQDGSEVKRGEIGEVVIDTSAIPNGLFCGYYNDEERTNMVWYDGFYHTGDTAYEDKDGYFWYVGRVDDMIKSSGYRVSPLEIEDEIMKLPYVLECAVTSVPNPIRGQEIKATVVLTEDKQPSEECKEEMFSFFKKNIADYKLPKIIDFVKELPKTISGKIRRAAIKDADWNDKK